MVWRHAGPSRKIVDVQVARLAVLADVAGALGEDKKPLFSNTEKREAEVSRILESRVDLVEMQERLDALNHDIATTNIEVEYRQELLRSARAAALLLGNGMGV